MPITALFTGLALTFSLIFASGASTNALSMFKCGQTAFKIISFDSG